MRGSHYHASIVKRTRVGAFLEIERIRRQLDCYRGTLNALKLTGIASRIDNLRRENRDVKTGIWSAKLPMKIVARQKIARNMSEARARSPVRAFPE